MSASFLLGLDLGTTVFKACVFARGSGAVCAQGAERLPMRVLQNGGREQDAQLVLRTVHAVLRQLRTAMGEDWARINGVGIAAQGGSSVLVTRTGIPKTPLLLWNDGRAQTEQARVHEMFPRGFWRKTYLRAVPPAGLGRLLWLKAHHPECFDGQHLHAGAGDFLFYHLTQTWRQEAGSAIQIGPYNARRTALDARPVAPLGLTLDFFAPLRSGHRTEPLARRAALDLGLPEGIPVAGPYIDQEAGYHAAAATVVRPLQISLGTAWVGNFGIAEADAGYSPFQLVLPGAVPGQRLVVQPLLAGNTAWDWALREGVGGKQALATADSWLEEQAFPHAGLVVIPWTNQMNPLTPGQHGACVITGAREGTTRADLVRAVALGLCCELRRVFDQLRTSGAVHQVVLSGGTSRSPHFRRLIAALMLPLPVYWQEDSDVAGARGALLSFGGKASRAKLVRVPPPPRTFVQEAENRYAAYVNVFEAVYGQVDAGKAYAMPGKPAPTRKKK